MEIIIKNIQIWCENYKLKNPRGSVNLNHEEYMKKVIASHKASYVAQLPANAEDARDADLIPDGEDPLK